MRRNQRVDKLQSCRSCLIVLLVKSNTHFIFMFSSNIYVVIINLCQPTVKTSSLRLCDYRSCMLLNVALKTDWYNDFGNKWAASSEFGTYSLCEQRRFRRACASAQSRQNLRCSLIQAVNQEEHSDRKPDPWPLWMAGHAQLKLVMTECSKTQIRLAGLKSEFHCQEINNIKSKVEGNYVMLFECCLPDLKKWEKWAGIERNDLERL